MLGKPVEQNPASTLLTTRPAAEFLKQEFETARCARTMCRDRVRD
jgi:hypothetical protein